MKKFLSNLGAFSLGPIASAFIGFITVPLITYFISPAEYGKASMFTLAQGIASMFMYLGMDQAFIREFNQNKDALDKLLSSAMTLPITLSLVVSAGIVILKKYISVFLFGSTTETMAVYFLAVMLPFMVVENFALLKIRMEERGLQYSFFNILLKTLILISTIILFILYERSFRSVVYAMAVGEILNGIILAVIVIKPLRLSLKKTERQLTLRMLKFGVPLIPAMMMSWVLSSMDKVMLRVFCGYNELGLYSAAFKIVTILSIVQSCFTLYWTPVAYRWNEEKVDKKNFNIVNTTVAVIMAVFCLGLLLVKNLVGLVLGTNFIDAIKIFPFILLYPILYTMSESTSVGIGFSRKTYYSILVSGIACIVNLLLNYLLIPLLGAIGASMATGVSFLVFFIIRSAISRKVWWRFDVYVYYKLIPILLFNCYIHTFWNGGIVYVFTIISIVLMLLINVKSLKEVFVFCKNL